MRVMADSGKEPEESALVRAAKDGGRSAFGALVDLHKDGVLVFLAVRMHDRSEAEDLAQETFLTAWRRMEEFDPSAPFGPWLRGIAHNLLRNHWRKHRAHPVGGSEELEALLQGCEYEGNGLWDGRADALEALRHCIALLAPSNRDLVQGRYEDGTSIKNLATASGHKVSATSMRLHRIRATLKTCIEGRIGAVTS